MKRYLAGMLIFLLTFTLFHPAFGERVVTASSSTEIISVNESKTVEDYNGSLGFHEPDMSDLGIGNINAVGYEYDAGSPIVTESVIQFDLGAVNPNRTIEKAELILWQQSASATVNNAYLDIYGSSETGWREGTSMPPLDTLTLIDNVSPISAQENVELVSDVTNYIKSRVESGEPRTATFVFKGATGPEPGAQPGQERRVYLYSMAHSNPSYHPKLMITYGASEPPTGSLTIEGNGFTNTTEVNLTLSAIDPEQGQIEMNIYNEGQNLEHWEPFQETKEWVISSGDGSKKIDVQFRNESGSLSEVYSTTVILDTIKPTGNLRIPAEVSRNGVDFTNTASVRLEITGNDAYLDQMCLSNTDDACTSNGWVSFASEADWTLDYPGDGAKNAYVWLKDKAGNISDTLVSNTIILDGTAPLGSVSINGEDEDYTNSGQVTLTLTADDGEGIGEIEMQFSNDGQSWSEWEDFSPSKAWDLSAGNGQKTVHVKLRDRLNNERTITTNIYLDTTPPTGSITINNDETHTNNSQVSLALEADDNDGIGQIEMQLSNDEDTWSEDLWEDFLESKTWNLSDEVDGEKTVYLKLRDGLGNERTVSSNIYLDRVPPVVTGVIDGSYYNEDKEITYDEADVILATLNGDPFASGDTVSEEDSYEVLVRDRAGNETVVSFTIDKTAPWVDGVEDGYYYNEDKEITYDEADVILATLNGDPFASGDTVSKEGDHELVVRDRAGNETVVSFTIDKTAPWVVGVEDGYYYNEDKEITYDEADVILATLNGDPFASGVMVSEEDSYEVLVRDRAGNETVVSFTIDKTAPWVDGVEDGFYYNEDKVITYDEADVILATLNGDPFASGDTVSKEGDHELVVRDRAGNETVVSFTIDKTAPWVDGVEDGYYYNEDKVITYDEADVILATLNGDPFASGDTVSEENSYEVLVRDRAGNETVVSFTIDKTAPWVDGVEDGYYYNEDKVITYDEADVILATLNGDPFASGDTVSEEDSYEVLVRDRAGNETIKGFTIDKTPPTAGLAINGGAVYTPSLLVSIDIQAEDTGGSTKLYVRLSESLDSWDSPVNEWVEYGIGSEPIEIERPWSFQDNGISEKSVFMQIKDEAGNQNTAVISESIIYQTIPEPLFNTISGFEDEALRLRKDDFKYENEDQKAPYSLKILTLPSHGELTLDGEPVGVEQVIPWAELEQKELMFTPELDWNGITDLVWTVGNEYEYFGGHEILRMDLAPVNDPPVAENLSFSMLAGSILEGQLRATDVDNEPDELSFELVEHPEKGEIRNFDQTGTFEFVSSREDHGVVTFTYRAFDGELYSEEATVEIHISRYIIEPLPEPPPSINPPVPPKQRDVEEISVRAEGILTQAVSTQFSTLDGKKVLRISFNDRLLSQKMDVLEDTLRLIITGQIDTLEAELTTEHFELLHKHQLDLEIDTEEAVYRLPIQLLKLKELKNTFGLQGSDVRILLRAGKGSNEVQTTWQNYAQKEGYKALKPILNIQLFLVQNEQEYAINHLTGLVSGLVSIPFTVEAATTTAVLLLEDGSLLPLPTKWIKQANNSSHLTVISALLGNIGFVQTSTKSFKDMVGHWAQEEVEHLASLLILNGRDHEHFAPNDPVNRAEFTAISARGLGLWTDRQDARFTDVKDNVWYEAALQAVLAVGLIQGYGDQTFKPQQEITLEEASVIIARALEFIERDVSLSEQEVDTILQGYAYQADLKPWSRVAIALGMELGLLEGELFTMSPAEPITRAQLAVMFDRLLRLL
ncbi:S-layer homology domain-containing protein [Bacillus horti]|uniref:GH43 family beta-xylosidase n=1 Tax=Caldalkalibacillus horti TaxID=77523 RepID=A0ABT9VVM7_9BACI|nr:S-layer homology domain-containing protein [Bacillus horti]MDQ0165033.1 GH43 family beta-xylosidase [Bacillus horti]